MLRYGYDDAGRLTSITDYDDSTLTYAYDAAGNVTSMTDYHGNTTTYTYTNRNELSTLTAPGSKTWTFHYNDLGQPTYYNIPNGMTTNYGYDSRNRLTAIEHKDGTTVLDGFYYDLDNVGNITATTHEDGSFWDYACDGRYRLTGAVRKNANATIAAAYAYTYDSGDNLLTKVEPFEDDFNDGNYTGWSVWSGTWSAAGNYLRMTPGAAGTIAQNSTTDNDLELRFAYMCNDTSNGGYGLVVSPRYASSGDRIYVNIYPGSISLAQRVSGVWSSLDEVAADRRGVSRYHAGGVVPGDAGDFAALQSPECDGQNVDVYRSTAGQLETKILETTACAVASTNYVSFTPSANADYSIDDIRILSDDLSNTTTFAVNNANELTSMTDRNGATAFGFDAWGRMTSKSQGAYSASYSYNYGDKLTKVSSDFPGEGTVEYAVGGDGARRQRTVGAAVTWYNYSAGWSILNEEDGSDNLTRTYIGGSAAHPTGPDPSTGDWFYYLHDHVGSTRDIRDDSKDSVAAYEFTPHGEEYASSGTTGTTTRRYTGHDWDETAQLYWAPYRYYSPGQPQWTTRDPLGIVDGTNLYAYAGMNPVSRFDALGLYSYPDRTHHLFPCGNNECGTVVVKLPIEWTGSEATAANIGRMEKCIEDAWQGRVDCWKISVDVVPPIPGKNHNTIDLSRRPIKNRADEGNAKEWNLNHPNPCCMAAHEAGHFMGLLDEYNHNTGDPNPGCASSIVLELCKDIKPFHWRTIMDGFDEEYVPGDKSRTLCNY